MSKLKLFSKQEASIANGLKGILEKQGIEFSLSPDVTPIEQLENGLVKIEISGEIGSHKGEKATVRGENIEDLLQEKIESLKSSLAVFLEKREFYAIEKSRKGDGWATVKIRLHYTLKDPMREIDSEKLSKLKAIIEMAEQFGLVGGFGKVNVRNGLLDSRGAESIEEFLDCLPDELPVEITIV